MTAPRCLAAIPGVTLGAATLALLVPVAIRGISAALSETLVQTLQVLWLAGLIWSLVVARKSLWMLASAPFALFWPWGLLLLMTAGCGFEVCD